MSPWNQKVSSREAWERAAEMHLSLVTCTRKRRLLGDHWRGGGPPVASAARSWWERSARSTRRRSSDLWRARHRVNCIFSARGESEGTGRVCHQMVESPCSTSSATSCWMYTMRPQRNPRQAALLGGAQLLARESASSIIWLHVASRSRAAKAISFHSHTERLRMDFRTKTSSSAIHIQNIKIHTLLSRVDSRRQRPAVASCCFARYDGHGGN